MAGEEVILDANIAVALSELHDEEQRTALRARRFHFLPGWLGQEFDLVTGATVSTLLLLILLADYSSSNHLPLT